MMPPQVFKSIMATKHSRREIMYMPELLQRYNLTAAKKCSKQ